MKKPSSTVVRQGEFDEGINLKALANAGLIPKANYQIHERYTKQLTSRIVELVLQNYAMPKLLATAPVSFFEPSREWQKEAAMGASELSMDMMGRSIDQIEFTSDATILPGFTKNYGYSWRTAGIAERNGVPLVPPTERQAIKRVLLDANKLGISGTTGGKIIGLKDAAQGTRAFSGVAAWSVTASAKPFDDMQKALAIVAGLDYEVPSGWNVGIHPTNVLEAQNITYNATTGQSHWAKIREEFGRRLNFVETTAVPEGTLLGIPKGNEYGELLTTGLPTVVPIKADAVSVEYQARMIAVPVLYDRTPFFKITI